MVWSKGWSFSCEGSLEGPSSVAFVDSVIFSVGLVEGVVIFL